MPALTAGAELSCDVALVGGGLANGLIALALAARRPDLDVRIVEASGRIGGHHLWSFFDSDVAPEHRWLVDPLIRWRWYGYEVMFPNRRRFLLTEYASIPDGALRDAVTDAIGASRIVTARATAVTPRRIELDDGRSIAARVVIDGRGPGDLSRLDLGWQKFVGQEFIFPHGHHMTEPVIMDATVPQADGYRFVYLLPFDDHHLFIEDTYYSDTPDLDVNRLSAGLLELVAMRGWDGVALGRKETGVLPVAIGGDFDAYWASTGTDIAKSGLRAGLFHATTGYSLPSAVRLAAMIPDWIDRDDIAATIRAHAAAQWRAQRFHRMLNTMLFRGAAPDQRVRVLEHFYRLPEDVIERFYAGRTTWADRIRVLSGRPPIPISDAVAALLRPSSRKDPRP